MKTLFRSSFLKDLKNITDEEVLSRVREAIEGVEQAASPQDILHLTKLQGRGSYYRIRVGEFRLGITLENDEVMFVRCLNRKDIYRFFP